MAEALFIGIDGGATHSTAVAAWPDGTVAAVEYGDGLNFNNIGTETVRLRIEDIINRICIKTGAHDLRVCIGSAALDKPADEATLRKFTGMLSPKQLDIQSDAYIALMGLTRGEPGMIAICGTGSMLLLADGNGIQHASGGWGYLMEDAGSGYAIAREGILAAIAEYEGVGPATAISRYICEYFGADDMRGVIDRLYAPEHTPDRLAGFARYVIAEAENGDGVSMDIIIKSMEKLAAQAAALFRKAPEASRIGLYGGIFAHSNTAREAFENSLRLRKPDVEICIPEFPPELGALIHIMKKQGMLTPQTLKNLNETYERARK